MTEPSPRPGPFRAPNLTARFIAAALLLLAFCVPAPAIAGWWDTTAEARETSLIDVRREPEKWRDVPILVRVSYTARGERTNPYFTQFAPERWRPITVSAPVERFDKARGLTPEFGRVFVRRGGADDLRLPELRPGGALLVRAIVRDVIAGEPWLEVLSITIDGDPLTAEESTRVREADRFLAHANPAAAEKLYRGVLNARRLASRERSTLLRKLGVALHDQKRGDEALTAFREALELDPQHAETRTQVAEIEARLARVPLAQDPAAPVDDPATAGAPLEQNAGETLPRTSARAAPTPPRPDAPLYLPGGRPKLAPPGGLPKPSALPATENVKPPKPADGRVAEKRTETGPSPIEGAGSSGVTPLPAPLPKATTPKATTGGPASERSPVPAPPLDADEEDEPPPVPPRPTLSGPK